MKLITNSISAYCNKMATLHSLSMSPGIFSRTIILFAACLILSGCVSRPLQPYSTDTTPQMLVPAIQTPTQDKRARFREIFCTILEARKETTPDYRECREALTTVGQEQAPTGEAINLNISTSGLEAVFVPGLGRDCVEQWLATENTIPTHLASQGYPMHSLNINGLGSSEGNAHKIRDELMAIPDSSVSPKLVFIAYSKGAIDLITAIINYPEIESRVAAVVSLAGAIGGSPLANYVTRGQLNLIQHFPGATCEAVDPGALQDLKPETRQKWLAETVLPGGIPYYSIITFPHPKNISTGLEISYRKLAKVDARNDGQLIFYDQFIPGSTLVAYLNADHWAAATPISRTHPVVGALFTNENAFPREALFEAIMRFVEEDLKTTQ